MRNIHWSQAIPVLFACSLAGCVTQSSRTGPAEERTETIEFGLFPEGGSDEFRPKSDLVELRSTQYPSESRPELTIHFRVLSSEHGSSQVEVALALLDNSGKSLHEDTQALQARPGRDVRQSFAVDHGVFKRAQRARVTFTIQE